MSSRSVKVLAVVVIVLFGILFALNTTDQGPPQPSESELMVPELKARLNDLDSVTITDADGQVSINREGDAWLVREKHDYPAQTASLRRLLLAIADARKIEAKTAAPDFYDRLGVQHPVDAGGSGTLVAASGADFGFSVILGNTTQGNYRYARIPEAEQSWLIDQNPVVPQETSDWLVQEIIDLDASRVRSVVIRHTDGESIALRKDSAEAAGFEVDGIPSGRELSYPTVANSIAGALDNLTLEDVRTSPKTGLSAMTTTTFTTFDGLQVEAVSGTVDEQPWISIRASVADNPSTGDREPVDESSEAAGSRDDAESEEAAQANGPERADPATQVQEINARTGLWIYSIAKYKADQLSRRWDDILKAETED
jgi:hypothetical protein